MSEKRILDAISKPSDIHCLNVEELQILSSEIREQIIKTTSNNGGHLAASLGAVELIVAAHSVLDVPEDKLLFDVGHQAYAHMLLCGRAERFDTLRKLEGFSGFPRPELSIYDSNVSGHASDSLSVAAGYATANRLNGSDSKVACIIGDASIEGGMAIEALSYIGAKQLPVVIILNDNGMSIAENVGAITRNLGVMRADSRYIKSRETLQRGMEATGKVGKFVVQAGKRCKDAFKHMLFPHSIIFEEMGILCTPAINGHDVGLMQDLIRIATEVDGPVLIHAITTKGKGYAPAQNNPEKFHGVGPFDLETGEVKKKRCETWTQVFGGKLTELGESNDSLVAITAAMEGGCGLKKFRDAYPSRFIDVGICEENAVGIASGLSYAGKTPVVCIYSSFLQRAYDQMMIDTCLENRHVIYAIDRAGLVGADGPSHHGLFDIAYLRTMPNMTIFCPSDKSELEAGLKASIEIDGPVAIRYPRGSVIENLSEDKTSLVDIKKFKSRKLKDGSDVAILAFGKMVKPALMASEELEKHNVSCKVIDMRFAKPIDEEAVKDACKAKLIVTIEDGILQGGAGEAVSAVVAAKAKKKPKCINLGIDNKFVLHGTDEELFAQLGLDTESIVSIILANVK